MSWLYQVYTHEQYLAGQVPKPFRGYGGRWIKPTVRVKAVGEPYINPLDHEQTK